MHVTCIICSDQITPAGDTYSTQCGHIFHYPCLIQWIDRSKSCPQCRQRATEHTIHKIFFNLPNTDHIVDDIVTIQNRLDNANIELKQKEIELHKAYDKYDTAKDQNNELQKAMENVEHKLITCEKVIGSLKDQVSYFKERSKENQKLNETVSRLKNQIKEYELVQAAIEGSRERLNELLRENNTAESLKLIVVTMKKALVDSENKKNQVERKLRQTLNQISTLKQEISSLKNENRDTYRKLEETTSSWNLEKLELKKVIEDMNQNGSTDSNNRIKRLLADSPMPLSSAELLEISPPKPKTVITTGSNDERVNKRMNTESPYLPVQSTAYDYLLKNSHAIKTLRANNVNKSEANNEVAYDGLGGHSKFDRYPNGGVFKLKRLISSTSGNKSSKYRKLGPKN